MILKNIPSVLVAYESHDEDILPDLYRFWTPDASRTKPLQIAHLFLCPDADHLPWIVTAVILPLSPDWCLL